MTREVIEAEIVTDYEARNYKQKYREYNTSARKISTVAWVFGVLSLPLAFIPFFGFVFALVALAINIIKKTPPILPILALVIAGIVSALFGLLVLLFTAIF